MSLVYAALSNPRLSASSSVTRSDTSHKPIRDASGHGRRAAQRAVGLDEVVREVVRAKAELWF